MKKAKNVFSAGILITLFLGMQQPACAAKPAFVQKKYDRTNFKKYNPLLANKVVSSASDELPAMTAEMAKTIASNKAQLNQKVAVPAYISALKATPSKSNEIQAYATTNITLSNATTTISTPGTYNITNSWTYSPSVPIAIAITASNVALNLNNKTLTGAGVNQTPGTPQFGIVIATGVSNVSIIDGSVTKFSYGVEIGNAQGVLNNIKLTNLNLSGQVAFNEKFGYPVFGFIDAYHVAYGSSILFAPRTTSNFVTISNVKANGTTGPATIAGVPTNTASSGMYFEDAKINNLIVENSKFDGHKGATAVGVWSNGNDNAGTTNGGMSHTWSNCTFSNNSDLGFDTLFTQDPSFLPGAGGASGCSYNVPPAGAIWNDITFKNCSFNNNTSKIGASGIEAHNIDGLTFKKCSMNCNVNSGDLYYFSGFGFEFFTNSGGDALGLSIFKTDNVNILSCTATGNQSTGGPIKGVYLYNPQGDVTCPVRVAGIKLVDGSNVIIKNVTTSNNIVNRPRVIDAKGIGIASYMYTAGAAVFTNIYLEKCYAKGNDIGYGFSHADGIKMVNSTATSSLNTGLYLNSLGYQNGNELLPDNISVLDGCFKKGKYGVVSAVTGIQEYVRTFACKNSCYNWLFIPDNPYSPLPCQPTERSK